MNRSVGDKESARLDQGRELLNLWAALFQALRAPEPRSETIQSCAERIRSMLGEIGDGGEGASFAVRARAIHFDGVRMPESPSCAGAMRLLARLLGAARVRSFHCQAEVELNELHGFARHVLGAAEGRLAPDEILAALKPGAASRLEVMLGNPEDEALVEPPGPAWQREAHFDAIGAMKSVYFELRSKGEISTRRTKRLVARLIESVDHDIDYALRLAAIKNQDEYTINHSVNITVFALALGRSLGMTRAMRYELGQAACLHELGKLPVPRHVLNKSDRLSPDERKLFHDHPAEGFFQLCVQLGISGASLPLALAAYEHHLNVDGTGYPAAAANRMPGLTSRIVAIADRYDAMTTPRVYRARAIPPPKALATMYHAQRSQVDPVLLRYFMNLLGPYPAGSALRLSDGSVGVVIGTHREEALRQAPRVRLILDELGERVPGEAVDLADSVNSASPLRIVEVLDGGDWRISAADFLS